jgi:hypothetical protein
MDLLKRFATFWHAFISPHRSDNEPQLTAPNDGPYDDGPISDTERLSRFIFDERGFTISTGLINFRQFLPPTKGNNTDEVSVMRTEALAEGAVWDLGQKTVAEATGRLVRARGDFASPAVTDSQVGTWQLDVQPDVPPARHALVVGWPPLEEREARKSLAQQLRRGARLVVP